MYSVRGGRAAGGGGLGGGGGGVYSVRAVADVATDVDGEVTADRARRRLRGLCGA